MEGQIHETPAARLARLLEATTPGEWRWGEGNSVCLCEVGIVSSEGENVFVNCGRGAGDPYPEDAEFIVAAHNDLLAVLTRLQALEEALTNLSHAADKVRHWHNTGPHDEGMIVSTQSVFALWAANDKAIAALKARP